MGAASTVSAYHRRNPGNTKPEQVKGTIPAHYLGNICYQSLVPFVPLYHGEDGQLEPVVEKVAEPVSKTIDRVVDDAFEVELNLYFVPFKGRCQIKSELFQLKLPLDIEMPEGPAIARGCALSQDFSVSGTRYEPP